jgi:nicotinamide riboside kinase
MTRLLITTGPESTGKTTLATQLSDLLQAPLVTEIAREYLQAKMRGAANFRYRQADLLAIARQQHRQELALLAHRPATIICDTDLLVLMVWSEVKYGSCDPWIRSTLEASLDTTDRLYLLCDHHIPWQPDPLREHPDDRAPLFERYRQKLEHYAVPWLVAEGPVTNRLATVRRKLG